MLQLAQKSERVVHTIADKELKKITSEGLNLILQKVTAKARFDKELDKFGFTEIKNEKIKKEEKKIILEYITAKKSVVNFLNSDKNSLENESVTTLIPKTFMLSEMGTLSENSRYAVGISAYCDILEGIANE